MTVAYPECFAWRASSHADHLAVSTQRRCVTADWTVWTGQMKNAVVCIHNLSGGRLVEVLQFNKHCQSRKVCIDGARTETPIPDVQIFGKNS